jgi:hypothetical protein
MIQKELSITDDETIDIMLKMTARPFVPIQVMRI